MNKANDIHSHNKSPYFSTTSLHKISHCTSAENTARNYKFSTPVYTFMQQHKCRKFETSKIAEPYFFDKFAKIGDATTSPTMKADERTPS
jgi:hypothetical protein